MSTKKRNRINEHRANNNKRHTSNENHHDYDGEIEMIYFIGDIKVKKLSKWQLLTLKALNSLCEEHAVDCFDSLSIMVKANEIHGGPKRANHITIMNAIKALQKIELLTSDFYGTRYPVRYRINSNKHVINIINNYIHYK